MENSGQMNSDTTKSNTALANRIFFSNSTFMTVLCFKVNFLTENYSSDTPIILFCNLEVISFHLVYDRICPEFDTQKSYWEKDYVVF